MSNKVVVTLMTNLINKKFYDSTADVLTKLDVYFAMNRIGEEDYAELALLAETVYEPAEVTDEAL